MSNKMNVKFLRKSYHFYKTKLNFSSHIQICELMVTNSNNNKSISIAPTQLKIALKHYTYICKYILAT